MPLELVRLLGRLKFRTSYSQNALRHSLEAARLAGMMAPAIGPDPEIAQRTPLFREHAWRITPRDLYIPLLSQ